MMNTRRGFIGNTFAAGLVSAASGAASPAANSSASYFTNDTLSMSVA